MCVCVYIYIYMCVCVCVYICVCVCIYIYVCVCIYKCVCIYIYIYIYVTTYVMCVAESACRGLVFSAICGLMKPGDQVRNIFFTEAGDLACHLCDRMCKSKAGLLSHIRAHKRAPL